MPLFHAWVIWKMVALLMIFHMGMVKSYQQTYKKLYQIRKGFVSGVKERSELKIEREKVIREQNPGEH